MTGYVLVDAGSARPLQYGVAVYNSNLLSTIADIAPQDLRVEQLFLADPASALPGWQIPSSGLASKTIPLLRRVAWLAGRVSRNIADRILLGKDGLYHALVAAESLDVDPARKLVSVHDCAALRPEFEREYRAGESIRIAEALSRCAAVVTVSRFTKRELISLLDLDPERIAVVPGGVDTTRFFPRSPEEVLTTRERYGLSHEYAIAVAGAAPRKRLGDVEAVADRLWQKERIELVMVGAGRGVRPGVRRLGYVPREHLPALYTGARALVSMSEYEGFGLAPIEAAACGTPVVAARAEAIVETLGEAARFVEVGDFDEAADAVMKLGEKRARKKLVGAGLERAKQFDWNSTAHRTLDVYRAVIGGRPPASAGASELDSET